MAGSFGKGVVPLLVALAVLLAGCAGGADADAPALPRHGTIEGLVDAVAARQLADGTARLSLSGEITGATAALRFTGQGVLRMLPEGVSVTFTQVVTQKGAAPRETGFVVLPDAVYLRLPPGPGDVPGKPWVRVDPDSSDPEAQRLAALAETLTSTADPAQSLARYAGATAIADAAADVIDGDPAVRYTIVVDLVRAAAAAADPAVRERLRQQADAGLRSVTSTLWLDAEDRPVRSAVRQELPGIGTLDLIGSYRDWGQPVEIAPPPASLVR